MTYDGFAAGSSAGRGRDGTPAMARGWPPAAGDDGYYSGYPSDPYPAAGRKQGGINMSYYPAAGADSPPAPARGFSPPPDYSDVPRPSTRYGGAAAAAAARAGGGAGASMSGFYGDPARPWYDPRGWRKRVWAGLAAAAVVIVVVVVPAVVVTRQKADKYPSYTQLRYSLAETYSGEAFFDKFDYFEGYDPANGFVHYVPQARAAQLNLTYASAAAAVLRVDTSVGPGSVPDASTGRFSVRVQSKAQYDSGLFVFDVRHTPYGCGAWPALWLSDPYHWPAHGEIDVMEAVNMATDGNQMTLHTTGGCTMAHHRRKMTGASLQGDCHNTTNDNAGCGVEAARPTYGAAFNAAGGGVMALEWRDQGIRMWQFARAGIPPDIAGGSPDPTTWGTALADFPDTGCDIASHFRNQSIIVNIDLCGDLTNAVYGDSGCPSNCTDFVANNPSNFTTAYWEFGDFKVYKSS